MPTGAVPEGTSATQLLSDDRCLLEGREMRHCVASYAGRAAGGWVALFSVFDPWGRSTIRMEVRLSGKSATLRLSEAKSFANDPAPDTHVAFALSLAAASEDPDTAVVFGSFVAEARACEKTIADGIEGLPRGAREEWADFAHERLALFLGEDVTLADRRAFLDAYAQAVPA